jgi:hypothetical protein
VSSDTAVPAQAMVAQSEERYSCPCAGHGSIKGEQKGRGAAPVVLNPLTPNDF